MRNLNGCEKRNRITFVEWNHECEFLEDVCRDQKRDLTSLSGVIRETVFARSEIHVIVHCSTAMDHVEQTEEWLKFGEKYDIRLCAHM